MKRIAIVVLSAAVAAPLLAQAPGIQVPARGKSGAIPQAVEPLPPELAGARPKRPAAPEKQQLPRIRTITIAGGEKVNVVYQGADPMPAETFEMFIDQAGPEIEKTKNGYRFNWAVEIAPKGPKAADLSKVTRVVMESVSGTKPIPIFSGKPEMDGKKLVIFARGETISREHYPWLYEMKPTTVVFRIRLEQKGAKTAVLIQPMRIAKAQKQRFRDLGVLGEDAENSAAATPAPKDTPVPAAEKKP